MQKSPNDSKNYQALTLANGLRLLLVENTSSTKAAAALAVNAGHFHDPQHRQGLAHFLEHMLFLGTKSYPDGSEYQKFINQHGGSHNAWTATEHTCFFFDINHDYFDQALDRFSRFFSEPLLSPAQIDSERQNIDAEFKLKLKDDVRRLYDVHKATINPKHPFAKFSVGNSQTLADNDNGKIRDELVEFFNHYYRAPYMTLVLESPLALSEMQALASKHFTTIKTATEQLPAITEPLYLPCHQQLCINIKPVKNDKQLIISFALPSIDQYYRHKSETLLAYLLGHEGVGSLLSLLKAKQWALAITAGSGINGSNFKDFNLSIALTSLGERHVNDIVALCFSYITLIKNSQPLAPYYYQEKQAISALAFAHYDKLKPLDSVSQLVINMHHYPEQDYIYGDYALDGQCDHTIAELLAYFTPENMRIIHISHNNDFDQISPWYQVPYRVTPIEQNQTQQWQRPTANNQLQLPEKNAYVVKSPKVFAAESNKLTPSVIDQSDGVKVWFHQDTSFNVPKGYIYISIDSPWITASVKNIAMARLFVDMYNESVAEKNYNAELAGIHYNLYAHQAGMTLQLSGLSEKQPVLLSQLLKQLTQERFSQQGFDLFKQQLSSHWHSSEKSKSISQLFAYLSSALQPKNPSSQALATALNDISFKQFNTFIDGLFSQMYLEVLIHGNWQHQHALEICQIINSNFKQGYCDKNIVDTPTVDTQGLASLLMPLHIPEHDHACVVYFPLADKSLTTSALAMITSQLLSADFFQEMRTEKQYGYLVGVGFVPINRYPGMAFYIQSPHTLATSLMQAINDFIDSYSQRIGQLSENKWQQLQQGLASQLTENDASLRIKSQRFWGAISNRDVDFDQKKKLIDVILSLTLDDIHLFLQQHFISANNPDKISLLSYQKSDQFSASQYRNHSIMTPQDFAKITKRKY